MSLNLSYFKKLKQRDKDIVSGYIRNMQLSLPTNNPFYNIPQIVNVLCALYSVNYDEWDEQCSGPNYEISEDGHIITMTKDECEETAFMKQIINNKGKYHWKFKLTDNPKGYRILLGIFKQKCDPKLHIKKFLTSTINSAYTIDLNSGWIMFHDKIEDSVKRYMDRCKKDDILDMYLNFNDLTLSFALNGENKGVAFKGIDNCQYRVAVWMFGQHSQIEYIPDNIERD